MKHFKHFIFTALISFFMAFSFVFVSCSQITDENETSSQTEQAFQNEIGSSRSLSDDGYLIGD